MMTDHRFQEIASSPKPASAWMLIWDQWLAVGALMYSDKAWPDDVIMMKHARNRLSFWTGMWEGKPLLIFTQIKWLCRSYRNSVCSGTESTRGGLLCGLCVFAPCRHRLRWICDSKFPKSQSVLHVSVCNARERNKSKNKKDWQDTSHFLIKRPTLKSKMTSWQQLHGTSWIVQRVEVMPTVSESVSVHK